MTFTRFMVAHSATLVLRRQDHTGNIGAASAYSSTEFLIDQVDEELERDPHSVLLPREDDPHGDHGTPKGPTDFDR